MVPIVFIVHRTIEYEIIIIDAEGLSNVLV